MNKFEPCLRFIAASDVHYQAEALKRKNNFEKGIALAYEYAETQSYKGIDAVYVNGDFSNSGDLEQMQSFKASLDASLKSGTQHMLTMASHEFMSEGEQKAIEKFKAVFGLEPDNHKVIAGFHFISVTTTNGCRFNDAKREWIKAQLDIAAADDPFKPIFFFQHPHITGTVYGSVLWGVDEITDILMNYPQIINFSGHSHAPVNDPRNIHQQHFTSVGTGSFKNFELDEFDKVYGTIPPEKDDAAQFLIVEADMSGTVVIKPYDVITESFFGYNWIVENPWEPDGFVYTDARFINPVKPFFAENSVLDCVVDGSDVNLHFTQAQIDVDRVNDYKITVRRKSDNAVVKQICIWSRYYLNDMPKTLDYRIEDMARGEYTVSIAARGFWNNHSINKLIGEFCID